MKRSITKTLMLLLTLTMTLNTAWADDGTIYYASLKAQKDPSSTGSGNVKLTWLDITGRPMEVDLAKQLNWAANSDIDWTNSSQAMQGLMYMGSVKDWNKIEGAETYSGPAPTAQVLGGTMIAMEGMETPVEMGTGSQIYMTSFVYFHAEAEPADGSYLAEWQIVGDENQYVTRMTSSMSPADPMGKLVYKEEWSEEENAWVNVIDEEKSIPLRTPCFKVLPSAENSVLFPGDDSDPQYAVKMAGALAVAQSVKTNRYNNIYAVFNKYLLGNPVATSEGLEAEENAQASLKVTIEVNGDAASLDVADFATFTFSNNGSNEWSYDLAAALASKEVVSEQLTRITIPVTYTYKNTGFGTKSTKMTISMAGDNPSSLDVKLTVEALDPGRAEAYWFDGKTEKISGDLSDMLDADISSYANPVLKLNKQVTTDLTFAGKNFTLDFNGNETQAITVSSGNVIVAYSDFGGKAASLTVNGGKAILNGGTFDALTIGANGEVEQNGATVSGATTNNGTLTTNEGVFNGGLTSSKTLTINNGTFKGETAVLVSGGTAAINRGVIEGTACGLKVTAGKATVKKLATIKGGTYSAQRTGGTLIVECGKFDGPLNGTIDFTSGYFKTNTYGVSTEGKNEMLVSVGKEYDEGYRYFLGTAEAAIANGAGVCRIGNVSYAKLEDAIAYANNNPSVQNIVIFMTNNYTLPAGYYTLPANATIVVPMSDTQEKEVNMTAPRVVFNDQRRATPYVTIQPTEFRRLTFASGVNMDVFGHIELTCSQYASNEAYTSQPVGPYGHLVMEEGSHLTLQSGSEVRAWGFVTGKGEMDARRGATVREMFQMGDWKGAMTSVRITGMVKKDEVLPALWNQVKSDDSGYKIFPVSQYFIQNIESPVKYHPGSLLSTSAAVSEGLMGMSVSMAATDIGIIGVSRSNTDRDAAIFLMDQMADAENTWVRKWYDAENDIQVYDINSGAHIGSMVLDMGVINLLTFGSVPIRLNSAKFDLPLTCNFKIHLLSGTMDFQQNTSLLPGAEVEVDKEATVTVAMDETEKKAYDAWIKGGKQGDAPVSYTGALYVYDAAEWNKYAYCNEYDGLNFQTGTAYTKTVRYAPSWNGRPTKRAEKTCPPDAKINVRGTFMTATGFVYTSESGANIFSNNEDAGTFIFNDDAVNAGTRTVNNVIGVQTYESLTFYPARLKHGDGTYENTDEAEKDLAYCYQNDRWSTMTQDGCFMKENRGGIDIYYAKPQEYVALANGMTENADHTYSDADGAGRLFILMDNCQWWEVEKKDNLYHCIHPNNDTYYEYGEYEDADGDSQEGWHEKRFTITWKNWNGDIIKTTNKNNEEVESYKVTYGTMAEFLGTNPTREATIDYTYDFTGWSPALGKVTSDVTYTATYTQKPRMYTIIFQNEGGVEIERQFLTHNEVPVCENTPTKIGHTLEWSPAIAAVVGDATYTATWLEEPPTEYAVTFYDYNGTKKLKPADETPYMVAVGDMPTPPANVNGKPATREYTYVFDHWAPALEKVSAKSAKSYTAVYREVAKTFPVNFYYKESEEADPVQVGETQYLAIGETPVIPDDERLQKTEDNANVYSLIWKPQIQTVIGHEGNYTYEYTASYTSTPKHYSLTLKCTPSGAATITGARADYTYGATPTITVTPNPGYNFIRWSDSESTGEAVDGTYSRTVEINGNIELTVVCECPDCDKSTIVWKNEAGNAELATDLIPVGSATIYHGSTPTKEQDDQYAYTFYGWTTRDNDGNILNTYKNGMTPVVAAAGQTYTYYACFTPVVRQYNVSLSSTPAGVCTLVGAGTYDYSESYENATVNVSGYDAANYTFDGWYDGATRMSQEPSYSFPVKKDLNLVAKFIPKTYTVTWMSEDGARTLETDANQVVGATTAFNGTVPAKEGYTFIGWSTAANGDGSYYAKGATPAVTGNANYYAYYAKNTNNLTISDNSPVTLGTVTDCSNFTITSNGTNSGQLMDPENLSLLGEAIFKLQPASPIPALTWYAVAAPWIVDIRTGIYADGKHLTVTRDFDIIEFNAQGYALNGAGDGNWNAWKYLDENSGVMQPGKLYMIYLASDQPSIEFHKTSGTILTTQLSLTTTGGSGSTANWNGIANPALYHADLDITVIDDADVDVLEYNYVNDDYIATSIDNMIVGQPIFVQVNDKQPIVSATVATGGGAGMPAYRRAPQDDTRADSRFVVELTQKGTLQDRLILQTAEEKTEGYVIGKDLAKMGIGSKTAQMWVERYDAKLCKNTLALEGDKAEFPLTIKTPANGNYTISANHERGDAEIYLLRDGHIIWNLGDAPYTLTLEKGNTYNYGLRVSAHAPAVSTDIEEAITDAPDGKASKVLVNGHIYIIRGDEVYSAQGAKLK